MRFIIPVLVFTLLCPGGALASDFPRTTDLQASARKAQQDRKVLVVYITMPGCPYCKKLETDLLDAAYQKRELDAVHFVELSWIDEQIKDFNGDRVKTDTFMQQYGVVVTPTMLFLGSDGEELSERLIGYRSEDFYWRYFQDRITLANEWID